MTKRADLIKQIYNDLLEISKNIIEDENKNIFPSLDDIDLSDLLNFINYELKNYYDNYEDYIFNLSKKQNINIDKDLFEENKDIIHKKLNSLIDICI